MNVLILTPDAVGSTLLQRLLTIYMQFHQFDRPVINLHELTNGLEKFYSPDFNREIITRRGRWGYHQSLSEIIAVLDSVDHYKTARLAQYHIVQRGDDITAQLPFYQYLDQNFYVIACRRENLFEHALSHAFNGVTKKLNVYTAQEKIDNFYGLYRSGIEIQPQKIHGVMNRYRDYLEWVERHFTVGSYFYYETHVKSVEKYILSLPVFAAQSRRISWQDTFDQEFEDWNRCHYYTSDLGSIAVDKSLPQLENSLQSDRNAIDIVQNLLPASHQSFLQQHRHRYNNAQGAIEKMQSLGILPSPVPIKKQTLSEKLRLVKNLDQCVEAFNAWVENHPGLAAPVSAADLLQQAQQEYQTLWDSQRLTTASATQLAVTVSK